MPVPASDDQVASTAMRQTVAALGATPALAAAKQHLRKQMKQRLASLSETSIAEQSSSIFRTLASFPPFVNARRVGVFLSMPAAEVQTDAIVRHALAAGKQVFVPYLHKLSPALIGGSRLSADDPEKDFIPSRVMDMVQLRDTTDYESLGRDRWGIPSVSASSVDTRCRVLGEGKAESKKEGKDDEHGSDAQTPQSSIILSSPLDIILMPGVAFDVDPATHRIHRCGHGKGFYDYFLHRYALKMASSVPSSADTSESVRLYGLALTEQVLPAGSVPTGPHDQPLDGLITGDGTVVIPRSQTDRQTG